MKCINKSFLIVFLLHFSIILHASSFKLGIASSMSKLRKDVTSLNVVSFKDTVSVDMARGEYESFQLVLLPEGVDVENIEIRLNELDQDRNKLYIEWFELGVSKTGRSHYSEHDENFIYDVLFTKEKVEKIKKDEFQPLWIRIKTLPETKSGEYKANLECVTSDFSASVDINIKVRNFIIPRPGTLAAPFGSYRKALEKWYYGDNTEFSSVKYTEWVNFISEYRLTPKEIGTDYPRPQERVVDPITKEKELVSLDLSTVASIINNSDYSYPDYSYGFYRLPVGSTLKKILEEGMWNADPVKLVRQIPSYWEEWQEEGLPEKVYVYGIDEPNSDIVRNGTVAAYEEIRRLNPSWKIMQTGNCNIPEFVGLVDIWCPKSNIAWQPFFQQRLAAGDILWQYVCVTPTFPRANLFIDEPGTNHRNLFWQTRKIGATGFLYWATTWVDGTLPTSAAGNPAFPDIPWDYSLTKAKNGDGTLIYPGKDFQPIASVRLEIIRDGIEDYEYFSILKNLLDKIQETPQNRAKVAQAQALLTVPDSICSSADVFTKDENLMLEHRLKIADAIEDIASEIFIEPTASYSVQVITDKKEMLQTCLAKSNSPLIVFPNPSKVGGTITIETDLDEKQMKAANIYVYSMTGMLVQQLKGTESTFSVNASGTYVIKLVSKDGISFSTSFIVK